MRFQELYSSCYSSIYKKRIYLAENEKTNEKEEKGNEELAGNNER